MIYKDMLERRASLFLLEYIAIVLVLGMFAVVAIPHADQMIQNSRAMARENELHNIQTAVTEMLCDSRAGVLESVGPTADISRVHTKDMPPLVLKDYLTGRTKKSGKLDCAYGFTSDGTVIPMVP